MIFNTLTALLHNYCTLFDSFYLSRGLAMYGSLAEHSSDFHLYIFAFDNLTNEILLNLKLNKVTVVALDEFETPELKQVKKERSIAEYCWTCTPSIISHVFKNFNVADCTYVDSDLFFYADPAILLSELDHYKKNVLITEHRFSYLPRLFHEKRAGRFCVQFLTFRNEETSLKILDKWRGQCIAWCYARYEDGRFGDQKYLDEWPAEYYNIHILLHQGGGVAPWNLQRYRFSKDGNSIKGRVHKTGSEFSMVFFHFQYVKFLKNRTYDVGWYLISSYLKKLFYEPYLMKIEEIETKLREMNLYYRKGFTNFKSANLRNIMKRGIKQLFGYNIMNI